MLVYAIKPEYYFYNTETVNDFTTRTYEGAVPSEDDLLASDESICSTPAPTAVGLWILAQQLLLRLIISQKVYAEASIAYFNTGFGPFGQQTDLGLGSLVGAPVQSMANGGFPSQEAVRSFVIPHHMGSQEKYRVNIVNAGGEPVSFGKGFQYPGTCSNTPRVMMSLRINLDGLYKRPTA
jgi:hypothetical protein